MYDSNLSPPVICLRQCAESLLSSRVPGRKRSKWSIGKHFLFNNVYRVVLVAQTIKHTK